MNKKLFSVLILLYSAGSVYSQDVGNQPATNKISLLIKPYYTDYVALTDTTPDETWSDMRYIQCQFVETIPSALIGEEDEFQLFTQKNSIVSGITDGVAGCFILPYVSVTAEKNLI